MLVTLLVFGTCPTSSEPPFFDSQHRPRLAAPPRGDTKLSGSGIPPELARAAPQATTEVPAQFGSDPDAVAAPARSRNVVAVVAVHTWPAQVVSAAFDGASPVRALAE